MVSYLLQPIGDRDWLLAISVTEKLDVDSLRVSQQQAVLPTLFLEDRLFGCLGKADSDPEELVSRKTLQSSTRAEDNSSEDEELEGVVEISSSDSDASTAHVEARHATLRARHKGKAMAAEEGKGKTVDVSPSDPTLASPTTVALAAAHQPRLRTSSSKRNSNTSVPTSAKRARCPSEAIPEDPAAADKTFIFRCLEQMITASDLQSLEGASPTYLLQLAAYHNFQLFQVGLNNAVKGLAKDSELLKSTKGVQESGDFQDEAMTHADMHALTVVDKWLEGEVGKRYLLDLGETDYDMGYQDAQKAIFELLTPGIRPSLRLDRAF
nr:hypothetical protein Iba_chr02eCG6970 [Ipomoea batatas]